MSTAPAPAETHVPLPYGRLLGVGAIIFLANAALLVLQLVAGRLLSPFIGSSLETWTSVIGVFLTGIALGNAFGGRLADRYPTPKTLAVLLVCGAVAALWMMLFPTLLTGSGAHKALPLGPRIPILAAVLCLPAGFVLSLLTPLAIKLGLPDVAHTGRVAGLIFALSTLGCLIGNYVTGFYLIPSFTINALVLVAAGALVALAGVAALMGKAEAPTPPAPGDSADVPGSSARPTPPAPLPAGRVETEVRGTDGPASPELGSEGSVSPLPAGRGAGGVGSSESFAFSDIRIAYAVVFLASFCGMTLELTASRLLAQQLGVSLFTWTGIIGVMLAGTALGNFCGGQLADRVNRPGWNPRHALAWTLCAAAGAAVLSLLLYSVLSRSTVFDKLNIIELVMAWTFALFFLPMFALGFVSPQVIRLAVPDVARVGSVAGRVYAWSTAGAIAGTFATGYLLLSTLGMRNTILVAGLVLVGTSLLVARVWKNNPLLYLFSVVLGGICGGFILSLRTASDPNLIAQVESNYYTIKVTETSGGMRRLTLDYLLHSSVDLERPDFLYYPHEYIQMEFLYQARRDTAAPRALVIGGGGYTFPRYAVELLPECHMDVVEIDPKVTEVARKHLGLKDYTNLDAIHMDGRQYVAERASAGTYDLIIQDAVNDFSVPAHLMTKEYNDAIKAALKKDGVYLLTIIDSLAYGKLWKAGMATLRQTFPEANVVLLTDKSPPADDAGFASWAEGRRVMIIYASDRPFDPSALEAADPGVSARRAAISRNALALPGTGPVFLANFAQEQARPRLLYTAEIPAARLKPYTDREPGVVLTDQFCPIDNLMAEVYRNR